MGTYTVHYFKQFGKWYLSEEVEIPDGTFSWDARPYLRLADHNHAVIMDGPWGPQLYLTKSTQEAIRNFEGDSE